jgi:DHA2 family methylenomycin A resistance protein-like MFS transporter
MDRTQSQRQILLATSISYVVVILDTSIVNVALERISTSLAGGVAALQWVVNAYTLTFASLLLTGGTLGDRIGARNVYIAGLAAFTVASVLCGAAPNLAWLIAGRVLQGAGAALLVPASMALINAVCPDPHDRAAAFGRWASLGGVAMASGPLLGGVLVDAAGWRSIFLLNVPVCLAGIAMARRIATRDVIPAARRFDLAGQGAAIAALALLNVSVIDAPARGWTSVPIVAGLAAAVTAGGLFVAIERARVQPMLPLDLFGNRVVSAAIVASMVSAFTFYGLAFDLGLYFQRERGYTPLLAGLAFLPLTVVVPIGSLLAKRIAGWLGSKRLVAGACAMAAAGYLGLATIDASASYGSRIVPLAAIGFAASLVTPVTTAELMTAIDSGRAGIVAGVLNAARQTGAALGVAIAGTLIAARLSVAGGMRTSLLISGAVSVAAAIVWWRGSIRRASIGAHESKSLG